MPKLKFSLPGDERYNTLLSIVALLQREGEMHIAELADHFDLSQQIIRSMLGTLNMTSFMPRNSEEQLPFYVDLERIDEEDGVVCLEFNSDPQGLPRITNQQSVALLAGLHFLQSLPEFEDSTEVDELISLLSTDQSKIQSIDVQADHFDSDLRIIRRAILDDRRIECRYVNGKGQESVRQIDPLVLINSEDHWYVRGLCLVNREVRTFRLDHMVDATVLELPRSEEAHKLASMLDETAPIYVPGSSDIEVTLQLAPEAYALAGYFTQLKEPAKVGDENIVVSIKVGYLPDLGPMVCRFGSSARVIAPAEAREVVRNYALKALCEENSNLVVE